MATPAGGQKVLWRHECGIGYAGPAVTEGKVFLSDRILGDGVKNPDNPFAKSSVSSRKRRKKASR